jgi:ketosteroid isomerase-like protein
MSDALTTVQNLYACFGRGDIAGLLQMLSPTVEWQFIGDRKAPYTGTVRGHGGVGEWFGKVAKTDDIQAFEPRQFLVGPDHVTVLGYERTRDHTTGREFECEWVHVMRVEGGKVSRFWGMLDTEAAGAARA